YSIPLKLNTTIFTLLATANGGYAILYAQYSDDESDIMSPLGGLYVQFTDYNKISTNPFLLFQITRLNMTVNAVHCNEYFGFCHYCIVSISYNSSIYYEEILFCSDKLMSSYQLQQTYNNSDDHRNVVSTPIGGYIFFAMDNAT
ncbi:2537_t:CDS:1, partial [Gigaspora rosea]